MKLQFKIKKWLLILVSCVIAGIVLPVAIWVGYLYATYISDDVTVGDAYGFSIGDSKQEAYEKVRRAIAEIHPEDRRVFIEVKVSNEAAEFLATNPDYPVMVEIYLHDIGFERFASMDRWEFYLSAKRFDSLTLTFCDDRLCSIYRHRKNFELP